MKVPHNDHGCDGTCQELAEAFSAWTKTRKQVFKDAGVKYISEYHCKVLGVSEHAYDVVLQALFHRILGIHPDMPDGMHQIEWNPLDLNFAIEFCLFLQERQAKATKDAAELDRMFNLATPTQPLLAAPQATSNAQDNEYECT